MLKIVDFLWLIFALLLLALGVCFICGMSWVTWRLAADGAWGASLGVAVFLVSKIFGSSAKLSTRWFVLAAAGVTLFGVLHAADPTMPFSELPLLPALAGGAAVGHLLAAILADVHDLPLLAMGMGFTADFETSGLLATTLLRGAQSIKKSFQSRHRGKPR